MKKILLTTIASSLMTTPTLFADGGKVIKNDTEVQVKYNPHVENMGFEIASTVEVDSGVEVRRDESKISFKPTHITSNTGQESQHKIELDLLGTVEKKSFTTSERGFRPFVHRKNSFLTFSDDGVKNSGSFMLLDYGTGIGAQVDMGKNSHLSAQAGIGLGLEVGKRDGIFDPALYAGAELNIKDIVRIVGEAEMRQSAFSTGHEITKSAEASVNLTNSIRMGLEFEQGQNTLADGTRYKSSYGGITLGGTWGGTSR
tara:strand:- start:1663 stop:2433 length:771 start_codon:yes stop_codon:yes gene_type:complete